MVQKSRKEENRGDEARDDEAVMCVGSSAVAATHFSGELNVPLTFLSLHVPVLRISSVFQEQTYWLITFRMSV